MGSKNGVFLNDHQITETNQLKNGDKLTIGPLEFFVTIIAEGRPQKPPKVKSVSDAVARTVAIQSENAQKDHESSIADWLASGEGGDEMDTRTIDASDLLAQLNAQSADAASREQAEQEDSGVKSGSGTHTRPGSSASSRDAASELLKKFFKGGK